MVKPLIAGNWKMNGLKASLGELEAMAQGNEDAMHNRLDLLVCLPATLLAQAVDLAAGRLAIGAQDCHARDHGAHTGDTSAVMIADCGASHVIVGHSERRADHGESDHEVREKAEAAARAGLTAIICVGETEGERRAGRALEIIRDQLAGSLPSAPGFVVAYEPVWAIGTGLVPTPADIAEVHGDIRNILRHRFGKAGEAAAILYGGSVKPANAAEILSIEDVNGALVGGASLKADDFLAIARACPL